MRFIHALNCLGSNNMRVLTNILRFLFCIFLLLLLSFSVYKLIDGEMNYYLSKKAYDTLTDNYVTKKSSTKDNIDEDADNSIVLDPEVSPIDVDFDELRKKCSNIQGWLYSPDTKINYPVVRCDNNDWYLTHLYDDTVSSSGTLFIDCENHSGFTDDNTVIYGHHMNNGSMFASIVNYATQSYYEDHPVLYLNTPSLNYRLEVISGYVTNSENELTYLYNFKNENTRKEFIAFSKSSSKISTNVDIKAKDKFVTLSTCTYEYDNARFVVIAKMVPIH